MQPMPIAETFMAAFPEPKVLSLSVGFEYESDLLMPFFDVAKVGAARNPALIVAPAFRNPLRPVVEVVFFIVVN